MIAILAHYGDHVDLHLRAADQFFDPYRAARRVGWVKVFLVEAIHLGIPLKVDQRHIHTHHITQPSVLR